jgi:hypothetical protein
VVTRLRAVLAQRCPVCLTGPMFRGRFAMHVACAVCGHAFEREPGFFQGAMYVSYILGTIYLLVLGVVAVTLLAPHVGLVPALGTVLVVHAACVPAVFRYSRVIWAHVNVRTVPRRD